MSQAKPQMRLIAIEIVGIEAAMTAASEADAAGLSTIDRLRPQLATLMGHGGVRALFGRALVLAREEVSWLGEVQVSGAGDWEGLAALRQKAPPAELRELEIVLLAQVLGLLVAFIGPSLTSRLVAEIWPGLPFNDQDFGKESVK